MPPKHADEGPIPARAKHKNIRISPAVIDAASRDGDELLRHLRTAPEGITQTEAEARASRTGPNEIAQERKQNWFVRLLKIIRNPLVILRRLCRRFHFLPETRAPDR